MDESLIIGDSGNRRAVHWPRRNSLIGETTISNIDWSGVTMDDDGYLYIFDIEEHAVRRLKTGEKHGILVAGGNGQGNRLDQLSSVPIINAH